MSLKIQPVLTFPHPGETTRESCVLEANGAFTYDLERSKCVKWKEREEIHKTPTSPLLVILPTIILQQNKNK